MELEKLEHMLEVELKNREQLVAAFNNQLGRCNGRIDMLKSFIAELRGGTPAPETPPE